MKALCAYPPQGGRPFCVHAFRQLQRRRPCFLHVSMVKLILRFQVCWRAVQSAMLGDARVLAVARAAARAGGRPRRGAIIRTNVAPIRTRSDGSWGSHKKAHAWRTASNPPTYPSLLGAAGFGACEARAGSGGGAGRLHSVRRTMGAQRRPRMPPEHRWRRSSMPARAHEVERASLLERH